MKNEVSNRFLGTSASSRDDEADFVTRRSFLVRAAAVSVGAVAACKKGVQESRTFSFGYDQPRETAYSFMADTFEKKLGELSGGTLKVTQFPSAALGQEPEMAQKVRAGDIDFALNTTANTSTIVPQSGVFSLHYMFRDEAHLERTMNDKAINDAFKKMIAENTTGAKSLGLMAKGFRNMYSKFPVTSVADVAGKKVRVQAAKTEDAFVTAYGAVPVHMPFGQVYTSLQTGLIQIAENANDSVLKNKHYEVAPVLSKTEHETDNSHLWVSQKTWDSLTDEQRGWVEQAASFSLPGASRKALELSAAALVEMQKLGVKFQDQVDKKSFAAIATPLQDVQARLLGGQAEKLLTLIRGIN
ncbi:MAG: TRAP transporter substrate-binding protein [Myxococcota bacterium]|nr:TRAP transporter substrate-binding protein [Myxococcota bacterium]